MTPQRIDLRAAGPPGLFYAVQTLRQLLPTRGLLAEPRRRDPVDRAVRDDHRLSAFPWRGLLIDPARHFIPVADVKHFIDAMALHKFNRLQMHLTDNEGWRIEIKKYPTSDRTRLADGLEPAHRRGRGATLLWVLHAGRHPRTGALRGRTPRHDRPRDRDAVPRRGGDRGLSRAWSRTRSTWRNCRSTQRWGQSKGLLGPRPETVAFMQDILAEVIELFPSQYIHIGGDEANLAPLDRRPGDAGA